MNGKMITKIGNLLYYFYYMVENDLIERGILIFSKINENQISDVIFNFLNRNINLFINKINKKELEGGTCLNEEKKKLI